MGEREELLHTAIKEGDIATISMMLGIPGLDVNAPDEHGNTPLMVAMMCEHANMYEIIDTLLKHPGHDLSRTKPVEIVSHGKSIEGVRTAIGIAGDILSKAEKNLEKAKHALLSTTPVEQVDRALSDMVAAHANAVRALCLVENLKEIASSSSAQESPRVPDEVSERRAEQLRIRQAQQEQREQQLREEKTLWNEYFAAVVALEQSIHQRIANLRDSEMLEAMQEKYGKSVDMKNLTPAQERRQVEILQGLEEPYAALHKMLTGIYGEVGKVRGADEQKTHAAHICTSLKFTYGAPGHPLHTQEQERTRDRLFKQFGDVESATNHVLYLERTLQTMSAKDARVLVVKGIRDNVLDAHTANKDLIPGHIKDGFAETRGIVTGLAFHVADKAVAAAETTTKKMAR